MNKTTWIIFSIFTVGILALLVIFSDKSRIDVSSVDINTIQTANAQDGGIGDRVFGKADSKVKLIEYADYQCPGCGEQHPKTKLLTEKYKGQIAFVFRNYPLTTAHPNAKAAAGAAEAAGLQGKYWEMHDKLYDNQSAWSSMTAQARDDLFISYAKTLGLDEAKFKSDIASKAVNDKIKYDTALGQKAGVDATPTFFLNGKRLDSKEWSNQAKFDQLVVDELKKAGIPLPK